MIDPWNISKWDRDEAELQEFLIFCRLVAGKNASFAAAKTHVFLNDVVPKYSESKATYFDMLANIESDDLMEAMVEAKIGNYTVNLNFFQEIQGLRENDLRSNSAEFFEQFPGIGPKTARFFIAHSRKGARVAVLDRHVLRWLYEIHGIGKYPFTTPQATLLYADIERAYLKIADSMNLTASELDTRIWQHYAKERWS